MPADALILGCGRSGTSIFGELFEALPGYRYWSEPALGDLPTPAVRSLGLGPIAHADALAVKVPRSGLRGDAPAGLPEPLDRMVGQLAAPVVVFWIVRHPLDAICSLRPGIGDGWAHHPRPPDWEAWEDQPLVERCAHHWATINGAGFEATGGAATVVRFEDLIADPAAFARHVAALVGADATAPAVAAWAARVRDRNDEHFVEAQTSRRHSRPDHERRVGRWQEDLSADEVSAVVPIVATAATTFGYDLRR